MKANASIDIAIALLLITGWVHAQPVQPVDRTKPNIVIIMADDLASNELSCYGGKNIKTPNIDALAKEGLRFRQNYASSAMCVPTRASLFTGLYPVRHGSFQNHKPVYDDVKSIGHYLRDLGYRVALTGKDHSTKPKTVFPFEIIEGFETNCVAKTADYSVDNLAHFVRNSKQPYCLFVMSTNPHAPWTVGDAAEFEESKLILPPHWVDTKVMRQQFASYLAEVRQLDNEVGDVMKMLRSEGQDKNTMVIFLGEQGPQFLGGKWSCWDHGQKSAMIVWQPGKVKPGRETDAMVQYEDITPTLIDLAGGRPVSGLDGISFRDVIEGKAKKHRDYVYGIHNNIPEGPAYPIRSVRGDRYKLILNLAPESQYHIKYTMTPGRNTALWDSWREKAETSEQAEFVTNRITTRPPVEFYDTREDPWELNNLANDPAYVKEIRTMTTELQDWMQQQGDEGASIDKVYPKPQTEIRDTLQLADPHIFFHQGLYYLYGTGSKDGFKVYTSRDLKNWRGHVGETEGFALKKGDAFGTSRFWAPQVFVWKDKYFLAYAADEQIAIAEATSPMGPFKQTTPSALQAPVKQIDPFVFIDDDGKKYLYHVRVANGGNRIFVAEMADDFSAIKPETLKECISATQGWENTANEKWSVAEGPTVLKHNGQYYLIYSANHFRSPDYAVGYAVSESPLGPWKKYEGNPILSRKTIGVNGTGHGDIVADATGNMFYVFHTHHSDTDVGPRKTALVKIGFTEGNDTQLKIDESSFRFLTEIK